MSIIKVIKSTSLLLVVASVLTACTSYAPVEQNSVYKRGNIMNGNSQSEGLSAFPAPLANAQRFVISLPTKTRAEESAFSVELQVGRVMQTDGVNRLFGNAQIQEKILKGWGYNYYEVDPTSLSNVASTKIGVFKGSSQTKYVALGSTIIRYNSRLPIVVYAPKDAQIRYRVWSAAEFKDALLK